jgi:hypothetical protein
MSRSYCTHSTAGSKIQYVYGEVAELVRGLSFLTGRSRTRSTNRKKVYSKIYGPRKKLLMGFQRGVVNST